MDEKICSRCREPQALSKFYKDKSKPDGCRYQCKLCLSIGYETNREEKLEYAKEYRKANREARAKYDKEYREVNKEKEAERHKKWREANRDLVNERAGKWREANPGKWAEITKRSREAKKAREAKKREEQPPDNPDNLAQ